MVASTLRPTDAPGEVGGRADEAWGAAAGAACGPIVPLRLHHPGMRPVTDVPLTTGVCFPKGVVSPGQRFCLRDAAGRRIAVQSETLARWSDGSARWVLLDVVAPQIEPGTSEWSLERAADARPAAAAAARNQTVVRDAEVQWLPERDTLAVRPGGTGAPAVGVRLQLTDRRGRTRSPRIARTEWETRGPVRSTLRLEGWFPRCRGLRLLARISIFGGTGLARLSVRLHNPNRARHRGGLWDLGDAGSFLFRSFIVEIVPDGFTAPADVLWTPAPDAPFRSAGAGRVDLYQDSSGGENWNSPNHVNREGRVPCRFRGACVRSPDGEERVFRASPTVVLAGASVLAVAVPEFWQQFPKSLTADGLTVRVGLFPEEWDDLHELQGGERKTHGLWLAVGSGGSGGGGAPRGGSQPAEPQAGQALSWVHNPVRIALPPEWYEAAGVFPWLSATSRDPDARLRTFLGEAFAGSRSVAARREAVDEYGWRNFGDLWADHEQTPPLRPADSQLSMSGKGDRHPTSCGGIGNNPQHPGPSPLFRTDLQCQGLSETGEGRPGACDGAAESEHKNRPTVSHYNNQFDPLYGAIQQLARTGDPGWYDLFDPLARHVMDIDRYHTAHDRAAYNGGLFWHTDHYVDAATCTHRTYTICNRPPGRPYGGGPSCEHNYTTGLLHYYYLTGDPDARHAVLGLADWVLAMDEGRRSVLGLFDDGPTGLATSTTETDYHGPGRGAGNSLNALLDAWLLTAHAAAPVRPEPPVPGTPERYLEAAEALIRRVIHPQDDVDALELLDVERRWSYTVFLAALARYLELKAEAGRFDPMFDRSAAALVHYARWMLRHERPYFDCPERLEYPTETWAAQELRKGNVLRLAARYAPAEEADAMHHRGNELADRAWSDLARFDSRCTARAVAIVMTEGPRDAWLRRRPAGPPRQGTPAVERGPAPFVPQKRRVKNTAGTLRGAASMLLRLADLRRWPALVQNLRSHW